MQKARIEAVARIVEHNDTAARRDRDAIAKRVQTTGEPFAAKLSDGRILVCLPCGRNSPSKWGIVSV